MNNIYYERPTSSADKQKNQSHPNETSTIKQHTHLKSLMGKLLDTLNMENWTHAEEITYSQETIDDDNTQDTSAAFLCTLEEHSCIEESEFESEDAINEPVIDNSALIEEVADSIAEYVTEESIDECITSTVEMPYKSARMIIKGCHLYFIDIAREVVEQRKVSIIPLMREYKLSESELKKILTEIYIAGIIDTNNNVLMTYEELEKFLDIYEPDLFNCTHAVFDKEILMCIGEIIFSNGVENVYDSLPADEVIDYLNILEKLKIIKYDSQDNQYQITSSYNDYMEICKSIPNSFSSADYNCEITTFQNTDYDNMTGIEFENFTAYILAQNNFTNIKITPASGDHGVDLLAEKDNVTYAIQCKCYSSNIGNAAVQQAHTGKSLYKRDIAVVLTNQYFTQQAKDEAKALSVKLWDRDVLNKMIN